MPPVPGAVTLNSPSGVRRLPLGRREATRHDYQREFRHDSARAAPEQLRPPRPAHPGGLHRSPISPSPGGEGGQPPEPRSPDTSRGAPERVARVPPCCPPPVSPCCGRSGGRAPRPLVLAALTARPGGRSSSELERGPRPPITPRNRGQEQAMSEFAPAEIRAMPLPDAMPVLRRGRHKNQSRGACFMEYTALLAGEPFTDEPLCVDGELAAVLRGANDIQIGRASCRERV